MSTAVARRPHVDHASNDGRLLQEAASLMGMGAWSCDLATNTLEWTDGVFELFGLDRGMRLDRRAVVEMYDEPFRQTLETLRSQALHGRIGFSMEARIRRPDGDLRWMRIAAQTAVSNGRSVRLYGMKQDITAERHRWEQLRRLAENDTVTGLANRARFHSEFLDLLPGCDALSAIGSLVLFDLNDFKGINDHWGHAAGDACLARFAERLVAAFPQALLTARIGGDEFALLLPATLSPATAQTLVRRQINALTLPIAHPAQPLSMGLSAGMAFNAPGRAPTPEGLFAAADAALYEAKRSGRTMLQVALA